MKSSTTEAKADANTSFSTPATTEGKVKKRKANPEATTEVKTKKNKSTQMTPMTPGPTTMTPAPKTPIMPMTRLSPTPSFGRRDDRRDRAQPHVWHHSRNNSWWEPKMILVGGKTVHEKAWWQLKRSGTWDTYYFSNNHGEAIWPAK